MGCIRNIFVAILALLLADAVSAESPGVDPFAYEQIFPSKPAPAITSFHALLQEVGSWSDLAIFNAVANALIASGALPPPPTGGQPIVVFAPTNEAFLRLLAGVSPPFEKYKDPAFLLGTVGKLTMAASNPDTPKNIIQALVGVVAYHISIAPTSEDGLQSAGKIPTLITPTLANATIDTSGFPKVVDVLNGTSTRYARGLKLKDDSLLFIVDRVLQPYSLKPLRDLLFAPAEGSATLPDIPDVPQIPGIPEKLQPFAQPNYHLGGSPNSKLPPAPFAYPFASYAGFLAGRADLQIFSALVVSNPDLLKGMLAFNRTVHPLVPTDAAFVSLITSVGEPLLNNLVEKFMSNPFNPALLSQVVQTVTRVMMLLPGLPSINDIVSYHVLQGAGGLEGRSGPQATLHTDKLIISRKGEQYFVTDGDASRPDAGVIATFPLLTGYVSVVDSLLLNFNLDATLAVLQANGGMSSSDAEEDNDMAQPSPEKADGDDEQSSLPTEGPSVSAKADSGSCFPADATVSLADGSNVAMHALRAGDMVRTRADDPKGFSRVFLFSHRDATAVGEVVRLETRSGHVVRATAGHYVYVDGRLRAFGAVKVGDRVHTVDGESEVVRASRVTAGGLYAPHALQSDLVVDGVWVSGYSTAVEPRVAEALLAPLRWVSGHFGLTEPLGRTLYGGADSLLGMIPRGDVVY